MPGLGRRVVPLRELEDVALGIPEVAPRVRAGRATLDLRDGFDSSLDELLTCLPDVVDGEPDLIVLRLVLRRRVALDELEQPPTGNLEVHPVSRAARLTTAQGVPIEATLRLEVLADHANPRRPPDPALVHLHLQSGSPVGSSVNSRTCSS